MNVSVPGRSIVNVALALEQVERADQNTLHRCELVACQQGAHLPLQLRCGECVEALTSRKHQPRRIS